MYVDSAKYKSQGKEYTRHLLRSTYRENGKVKHRTHGCLNNCTESEINAIKLALKEKENLCTFQNIAKLNIQQGASFGALYVIAQIAEKLKIKEALSVVLKDDKQTKIALWQIIFKTIHQGSKLASIRHFNDYAIEDVLDLDTISKYDVYKNLSILSDNYKDIEQKLFTLRTRNKNAELFLYDVTSTYLEGEDNEFAKYGYNRDKKSGKLQIVIGLLTDEDGIPISSTIFEGNTVDIQTVKDQIDFLSNKLNISRVTIVGDRGMLKGPQIQELPEGYSYITAISKRQISRLIAQNVFPHDLFAEDLHEIEYDNKRYIMRLNEYRREEISATRDEKILKLERFIEESNKFLSDAKHKRATVATAFKKLVEKCEKLNLSYVSAICDEVNRTISIAIDHEKKLELESLDGCYCLITDLPKTVTKEMIHSRYKGLSQVERAFRTIKTDHLELRPIYVRKKESTEAHVLITTLAYSIVQELNNLWSNINITTEEGLALLDKICYQELSSATMEKKIIIPTPSDKCQLLLDKLNIKLPIREIKNVTTKKNNKLS